MKKILLTTAILVAAVCPTCADPTTDQAITDIVAAQTKLNALKSLTADVTTVNRVGGKDVVSTGTVKCLKPNYLWIEMHGKTGSTQYRISDGKDYCSTGKTGKWTSTPAAPDGANFRDDLLLWSDFYVLYATDNAKRVVDGADVTIADKTIDDHSYEVITAAQTPKHPMTMTVYIGKWDQLIHRMTVEGGPAHMDVTWSNIKQNAPLEASEFKHPD